MITSLICTHQNPKIRTLKSLRKTAREARLFLHVPGSPGGNQQFQPNIFLGGGAANQQQARELPKATTSERSCSARRSLQRLGLPRRYEAAERGCPEHDGVVGFLIHFKIHFAVGSMPPEDRTLPCARARAGPTLLLSAPAGSGQKHPKVGWAGAEPC